MENEAVSLAYLHLLSLVQLSVRSWKWHMGGKERQERKSKTIQTWNWVQIYSVISYSSYSAAEFLLLIGQQFQVTGKSTSLYSFYSNSVYRHWYVDTANR